MLVVPFSYLCYCSKSYYLIYIIIIITITITLIAICVVLFRALSKVTMLTCNLCTH